jgi:hypothetical protein
MNMPFNDAQAAFPFVIAQGRNIETRIYKKRYPTFNYSQIIPIVTEGQPWAIGTTFFTVDSTGQAKILSGKGTDVPFVSSKRGQASHDYWMIGAGWEWTLEEINQASLYGINLSATDAEAASNAVERLLYETFMAGSTEKDVTGFVNDANVNVVDAAQTFEAATPQQAAALVNDALSQVRSQTNEVEWADTVAFPPAALRILATKSQGAGDGTLTVLEYIRRNNIYTSENNGAPLNIVSTRELSAASEDGDGRMVVYRRDEEVLRGHLPLPRRVLDPRQASLMGYEQGIIARTGGTEVRLPGAMLYVDGVAAAPEA